jgi:MFS family permease
MQGLGGAMLVPGSLALISAFFPEKERGAAIGMWSAFSAVSAGIGPILGGYLVESFSWRWAFLINVPLAAVVVTIALFRVPESAESGDGAALDWQGALLATFGLGTVVFALIESPKYPFFVVAAILILGLVLLTAFLWRESTATNPMMPLPLFRSRNFSGANLLTFFLYCGLGGFFFFFPFNLIQVHGYSASTAGAAISPFIVMLFAFSRPAGIVVDRYGARIPLVLGPILAGLGFLLFAIPGIGSSYWTGYFPAILLMGLGMSLSVAPLSTTVMNAVEARFVGVASGVNNAVSRTAGLIAIAVFSVVVQQVFDGNLDARLPDLNLTAEEASLVATERVKLAGAEMPATMDASRSSSILSAIDYSYLQAFRVVTTVAGVLAILSAIFSWTMIRKIETAE